MYDGKEYGKKYKRAHSPAEINNKLVYIAIDDNDISYIIYDGENITPEGIAVGRDIVTYLLPEEKNDRFCYVTAGNDNIKCKNLQ